MSSTTTKKQKALKSPFPLDSRFPTPFERRMYKLENFANNRLYPVPPLYFSTAIVLLTAFQYQNPSNAITSLFPNFGSKFPIFRFLLAASIGVYIPVVIIRLFLKHFFFSYKGFLFEKPNNPSLTTKLWGMCRNLLAMAATPRLRSCDSLLPNLPVPSLSQTVERYLESIQPLLDKEKFEEVSRMAKKFESEEGRKLQFLARLYSCFVDNYVTGFWEKYAYLYSRECPLISSSVAHCDLFEDTPANQAVRAAHIVYIEALSMLSMDMETLPPIGGGILCTSHYRKCYATTRVPGKTIDRLKSYGASRHVAVLYKGCFYKVDVFGKNNVIYSLEQLTQIFLELLTRNEKATKAEEYMCALTTDRRDIWCRNREKFFLNNPVNRTALDVIESAIAFIVLEETSEYDYDPKRPEVLDGFLKNMLTGNGKNRWADKSLNYSVSANGRCGGTTEHSIGDGSEFDHIMENFVFTDTQILKYPSEVEEIRRPTIKEAESTDGIQYAKRLQIDIGEEMEAEIYRCYNSFLPKIDDVDLAATVFCDFGKGRIKEGKVSPDAFVQMAIQLANYKDQGKFVLTYESASSRFYANSRTETLRTVTAKSCAFVLAMLDPNSDKKERLKLLREASELHGFRNRECMVGKGVDRHLFVLFVLSKAIGIESPFLSYYIAQPWLLSTSQAPNMTNQTNEDEVPNFSWIGACFGATAKEGYGICYRFAGNHSICIHITSYKSAPNTDSHRFQKYLSESLNEMSALFHNLE